MRRIVLFSTQTDNNARNVTESLFPDWLGERRFAFLPSDGIDSPARFRTYWEDLARANNATFDIAINSYRAAQSAQEADKIRACNILFLSGGNTFRLLRNLRNSGLDQAVIEFAQRENTVLAGASAGAIVLTPSIGICGIEGVDENRVGLTDLAGLGIVGFEIFPHYEPRWDGAIAAYESAHQTPLRKITNEELIVLDSR